MFIHLFNHCLTERERTYIIISHSSSCGYIVDVLIFPPGASWCVMGIQLRQSASDGQRQVVGIFHGRGRITRRRGPRTAVLPRPSQHIQVHVLRGPVTRPIVPRALVLPSPLQYV